MKKLLAILVAAMLVLSMAAFAEEDTFLVGAYTQMSGDKATYGMEVQNNLEMAIDYINENGGFNGQKVELVMYDTQGSPEEAVKIAARLLGSDHVDAVVASVNSGEVFASPRRSTTRACSPSAWAPPPPGWLRTGPTSSAPP